MSSWEKWQAIPNRKKTEFAKKYSTKKIEICHEKEMIDFGDFVNNLGKQEK